MANSYFAAAITAFVLIITSEANFDYGFPVPPIDAQTALFGTIIPFVLEYDSPIQIRFTSAIDAIFWNCIAVYDEMGLDALTKTQPLVRASQEVIDEHGNSETRVMCAYYASAIFINDLVPAAVAPLQGLMTGFGLNASAIIVDADVAECAVDDADCLKILAGEKNYSPQIMGSVVAHQVLDILDNDGWNAKGQFSPDGSECTANCVPYRDYTGFEAETKKSSKKKKKKSKNKWQPLTETNGLGYQVSQEHIVPHAGTHGVPRYSSRAQIDARLADEPKYKYEDEVILVVKRLKELAESDRQKVLTEFFNDKLAVALSVVLAMDALMEWTYEERVSFIVGYTAAEYEAILTVWKEKRRFNLVRPTTLIKEGLAGEEILTYAGPLQGVKSIDANDFEAYVRVMPHSEFPSGSGCICASAAEFTDALLEGRYNIDDSIQVSVPAMAPGFVNGSSRIEPGVTPKETVFQIFESMTELSETCGDSRLWGGMHFTTSVPAAQSLCEGIGARAWTYVDALWRGDEPALVDLATGDDSCDDDDVWPWETKKSDANGFSDFDFDFDFDSKGSNQPMDEPEPKENSDGNKLIYILVAVNAVMLVATLAAACKGKANDVKRNVFADSDDEEMSHMIA